jgi:hypothetical protein
VRDTPGVTVVASSSPDLVTIEADEGTAARLQSRLAKTHHVEPEIRRSIQ